VMVHSANGHRPRKGGNGGAPPDLYTTALALHSTPLKAGYCDRRRHRARVERLSAHGGVSVWRGV